jgi:gluconate 2-dehydrogenase gamma chain
VTDDTAALAAVLERLIPSDEHGPGAREAQVIRYVQRRRAEHAEVYANGLAALDEAAGTTFAELGAERQDELLHAAEARSDPFFALVLAHATEAMFGDPAHGGNADRAGWELLGYPGPAREWSEREQRLGRT